jgi:hypothetical protein
MIFIPPCTIIIYGHIEWIGEEETGHILKFNSCTRRFFTTSSTIIGNGIESAVLIGTRLHVVGPFRTIYVPGQYNDNAGLLECICRVS